MDNFEEYNDPSQYDKENDAFTDDIFFLLKWASKTNGIIFDLACGTGRATIPLAKKGYKMVGVDLHGGMLEEAKRKSSSEKLQVQWVLQDCTKLDLEYRSHLIYMVGNSFQHFLTNEAQDGLLSSVNKHLHEGGIFIFGTRFPSKEELLQPTEEEYWRSYKDSNSRQEIDLYTISTYDELNQIQHYTTIRKFKDGSGNIMEENRTKISLRYVFPKEMERILSSHGFDILHIYEDWKETPVKNGSEQMIYVCQKKSNKTLHSIGSMVNK